MEKHHRVWIVPALLAAMLSATVVRAEPVVEEAPPPRRVNAPNAAVASSSSAASANALTLAEALRWTLRHNPQLAVVRKQRGVAQAGIVIANTYPYNPIFQHFVWGDNTPPDARVSNRVFEEHTSRIDVELHHQGRHRRAMAHAALSRTEWEIAAQELLVAVQLLRAFDTVLYRRDKLRIGEDLLRLQEEVLKKTETLAEQAHLARTDLMLARADLADARIALGPARNQLVVARNALLRLLGVVDDNRPVTGTLEAILPKMKAADMVHVAERKRPDLHALEMAVKEAEAAFRLQVANRWGNPSIGPAFEQNESNVSFIGMWLVWSPPVLNTRKGEIFQRKADVARAAQAAKSLDVTIQQDVLAALKRLNSASELVEMYRTQTLPQLRSTLEGFDRLFARGEAGMTFGRVIAIRQRLIRTRSAYLDALFEWSQARADLAAAVGDPSLALPVCIAEEYAAESLKNPSTTEQSQ